MSLKKFTGLIQTKLVWVWVLSQQGAGTDLGDFPGEALPSLRIKCGWSRGKVGGLGEKEGGRTGINVQKNN